MELAVMFHLTRWIALGTGPCAHPAYPGLRPFLLDYRLARLVFAYFLTSYIRCQEFNGRRLAKGSIL